MSDEVLKRIGKYELLEFLGGGMSHVYRAVDPVLGRTVAVKILTEQGSADQEARARFLQEARISSNIVHDNIIRIFDYGEENALPYIVMEFLVGEDLRHAIRNGNTGGIENRLRIALQVARALEFVHGMNVIHRDLKPENVHLDANGRAKLMDFGIAKSEGLSLTKTGFAMGTPYYMAPEQVLGKPTTQAVDIYAFGILLCELLTGHRPVESDTVERLFYMILHEPIDLEPLRQCGANDEVVGLAERCTAKAPADRPASFGVVCRQLEAILGSAGAGDEPAVDGFAKSGGPGNHRHTGGVARRPAAAPVARKAAPLAPPVASSAPASGEQTVAPPPPAPWPKLLIYGGIAGLLVASVVIAVFLASKDGTPPKQNGGKDEAPATAISTTTGEMLLVPAGAFLKGQQNESVELPAFYLDKTEVPNEAYARFMEAADHVRPTGFNASRPDAPVVNVDYTDAADFCRWAGKRLPTGDEWEKAARGADGRIYAWGNQAEASRAAVADNPGFAPSAPMAVNSLSASGGTYGMLHLTGNVLEWVEQRVTPSERALQAFTEILKPEPTTTEPWYQLRGGSFDRPLAAAVTYEFISAPARFLAPNVGFRCAADVAREAKPTK